MAKSKKKSNTYLEEDETPISFNIMKKNVVPLASPVKEVIKEFPPQRQFGAVEPVVVEFNEVNGSFLACIRERRGLTVDEISSKTRIPKKYIYAIEADDYMNLPAPIYFRGFVQSYLREIGLGEQKNIIDALLALYQRKAQAG